MPVIATDVGGNSELIENGQNGLLVPVGDFEKLAEAFCDVLGDSPRLSVMGLESFRRYEKYFSIDDREDISYLSVSFETIKLITYSIGTILWWQVIYQHDIY